MNRLSVKMLIGVLSFSLCAESAFASSVTDYENAAIAAAKKRNEQLKKRRAELETEARKKAQIELEEKQRQEAQQREEKQRQEAQQREEARKKAQIELEEKQRQEAQQREIEQKAELAAQEKRKIDEWYRQLFIKNFADNIKNLKNCSQDFYVITALPLGGRDEIIFDEIKSSDSSVNLIDIILQSLQWEGHPHKVTSVEKLNDPTAKNYFTVEFIVGDNIESYIESHADNLFTRQFLIVNSREANLQSSAWENMKKYYFKQVYTYDAATRLTVKLTQNDSGEIISSEASGEIGRCSIPTF